jgi:hypothetical protein
MKKIYAVVVFLIALAMIIPVSAAPLYDLSMGGDVTYDLGLGLEMISFVEDCAINSLGEVDCVFDITAKRTTLFFGGTILSVNVPVNGVPTGVPVYWWETDTHDNNEGHFTDTILLGFANDKVTNGGCHPNTDSVSPLGGPGSCASVYTVGDNHGSIAFYMVPTGVGALPYISTYHIEFRWSLNPVTTCGDYVTLTSDDIVLDPTLETPLGSPSDTQIFTTVTGETYSLALSGGPWNDGAADRGTDTAISWDGVTWTPLSEVQTVCYDTAAAFITAASDTLYVRVNDTAGAFADNINNPDPVTVTISLMALPNDPCDTQFSYDELHDWVASIVVQGDDSDGVLVTEELVTGEWYVVQVASGTWQDEGAPPDHVDMEYYNGSPEFALMGIPYADLSGGSNVLCQSETGTTFYIQAKEADLYLRVNNAIGDFAANTGALNINVYHSTFTRTSESCEQNYELGELIDTGHVEGTQENGDSFAFMVGASQIAYYDGGLVPGAWYVLDTTEGPWQWKGALHSESGISYDMAVSENGSTWTPLADWDVPVCNIELDALGHRRIVFQAPEAGAINWKLRVDDSSIWFNNGGGMSWNLYAATKLQAVTPEGTCDYAYDIDHPVVLGEVKGNNQNGVLLNGLNAGSIYALKVVGEGYGWTESLLSGTRYDTELSPNGGLQYYDLPDGYPSVLCSETSGNDIFVYLQPGQNYKYQLRVNSTTFSDNTGKMGYVVYPATPGQSISNTCFNGWYGEEFMNGFDWIDVREQDGELIAADTARWEEFNGLIAGRTYMIETPAGQGPWWNGSDTNTKKWDVAVTNDNGTTWEPVTLASTMIDCASYDAVGHVWKARISVSEGQVWKIRVNDTNGGFADNQGNMAYKLQVLCDHPACTPSIPNDSNSPSNQIGAITIQGGGDVCAIPVVRPGEISAAEIFDLGNYLGGWVQYINLSIIRYMAWCPKHTDTLMTFLDKFKEKEPLATITEWMNNLRNIKTQIDSYNWGPNSYNDTSLFDVHSRAELDAIVSEHFLPKSSRATNPWNGGNIVNFNASGLPDAYYSCDSSFVDYLPAKLRTGVCFVSAYFIETGASFWIQLMLDISALFLIFSMIKGAAQELIYMMTGVRPWTKSGAESGLNKLMAYYERKDKEMSDVERELGRQLGGEFGRNADGSYSRRR